jgi:oligopeptide/dipeptide ABC transporter ATP-binding protein
MTALNPVHKIGKQIAEVIKLHNKNLNQIEIENRIIELLQKTEIPDPKKRINEYPHQISGGMRQRVVIAIALACEPSILIADEPTTALDATIQAQIIELIKEIKLKTKMSVIFISHDLGVIAEICDKVAVMYAGKIIETGKTADIFNNPAHPYTKGLINSIPTLKQKRKTILNTIKGMVPEFASSIKGCKFENRCSYAQPICKTKEPEQILIEHDHLVNCLFPLK